VHFGDGLGVVNDYFIEDGGVVDACGEGGGEYVSVEASCEWRQNLVQENEKCG